MFEEPTVWMVWEGVCGSAEMVLATLAPRGRRAWLRRLEARRTWYRAAAPHSAVLPSSTSVRRPWFDHLLMSACWSRLGQRNQDCMCGICGIRY
jgi:hypothetical protein